MDFQIKINHENSFTVPEERTPQSSAPVAPTPAFNIASPPSAPLDFGPVMPFGGPDPNFFYGMPPPMTNALPPTNYTGYQPETWHPNFAPSAWSSTEMQG